MLRLTHYIVATIAAATYSDAVSSIALLIVHVLLASSQGRFMLRFCNISRSPAGALSLLCTFEDLILSLTLCDKFIT